MNEARYRANEQRLWRSLDVQPRERAVRLAENGVAVRVQEVGEGAPVLFVHGATNAGTSWAPLVARLPGWRCLLLDRPGCGLSEPLEQPHGDPEDLARFGDALLVDVLDKLEIESAHVIATSFGGYLALRFAAAHPRRVGRMVELGWPVGAPVGKTPLAMRLATAPVVGPLMASLPPNERVVRAMLRNIGLREALESGRVTKEAVGWYTSLLRDTPTLRNEVRAGPRIVSVFGGMNEAALLPDEVLSRVLAPIHFIWGEADVFGGPAIAREFVARLPGGSLELWPGVGHAPWMDDAERAASSVTEFLNESHAGRAAVPV